MGKNNGNDGNGNQNPNNGNQNPEPNPNNGNDGNGNQNNGDKGNPNNGNQNQEQPKKTFGQRLGHWVEVGVDKGAPILGKVLIGGALLAVGYVLGKGNGSYGNNGYALPDNNNNYQNPQLPENNYVGPGYMSGTSGTVDTMNVNVNNVQ